MTLMTTHFVEIPFFARKVIFRCVMTTHFRVWAQLEKIYSLQNGIHSLRVLEVSEFLFDVNECD